MSSVDGYIWYTPLIPIYLTPMYILYILKGVMYVSICTNTYQYIPHTGVCILV
jgi:hypothetical protein